MRRIVMFNHVTADGYFAGPDGNLDWVMSDEEADRESVRQFPDFDTVMLGRKTYDMFAAYWPKALDHPGGAADPHGSRKPTPEIHAIAVWLNAAAKLVFSKTLKSPTWNNTRILREFDAGAVADLKRQPGKHMMVFGSASIVSKLTEHGLIDEYRFLVSPLILGKGRKLLDDASAKMRLRLLEAAAHRSGHVMLRHARAA
jgi:dihydrofolate reductase